MVQVRQKRTTRSRGLVATSAAVSGGAGDSLRLGIFGAAGSGKSYKAKQLTAELKRLIIFDPLGEYAGKKFFDLEKLKRFIVENYSAGFRAVFIPPYGGEIYALDAISKFLVQVQQRAAGAKITLCVDEMDLSYPSGIRQTQPRHGFGFLCLRGRHFGVNLVGVSQRPSQVDISFRANLSAVYYFRLAEPADIETALKNLGREHAATLRGLKNREYLYKNGAEVLKK